MLSRCGRGARSFSRRCCGARHLCAAHSPLLPPLHGAARLTLALDLDEVLVHSENADANKGCFGEHGSGALPERLRHEPTYSFAMRHPPQPGLDQAPPSSEMIRVHSRPAVVEFLTAAAEVAELCMFTSATRDYAAENAFRLDPTGTIFAAVLSREHCTEIDPGVRVLAVRARLEALRRRRRAAASCPPARGTPPRQVFVKDLSRLGRPLERVVLVDDTRTSFLLQPDNGVECKPYFGDRRDGVLIGKVLPLVRELAAEVAAGHDVRTHLRAAFGMEKKLQLLAHLRNLSVPPGGVGHTTKRRVDGRVDG